MCSTTGREARKRDCCVLQLPRIFSLRRFRLALHKWRISYVRAFYFLAIVRCPSIAQFKKCSPLCSSLFSNCTRCHSLLPEPIVICRRHAALSTILSWNEWVSFFCNAHFVESVCWVVYHHGRDEMCSPNYSHCHSVEAVDVLSLSINVQFFAIPPTRRYTSRLSALRFLFLSKFLYWERILFGSGDILHP